MANAFKSLFSASTSMFSGNFLNVPTIQRLQNATTHRGLLKFLGNNAVNGSRAHCTLSAAMTKLKQQSQRQKYHTNFNKVPVARLGTEVDKEISKFLEKEIQFEKSRSSDSRPKVSGFDITTDGADVTLTKTSGSEKVVVRLTVNGCVDSVTPGAGESQTEELPQMVCRPPFEVEISKGDGSVLALQCSFPVMDGDEDLGQQGAEQIDDQFEIQEVAIHDGEWKDTTYSISAATMDAELFDLLMDMLDERGINDEFIAQLVDYCTSYENQKYISLLGSLKKFVEK